MFIRNLNILVAYVPYNTMQRLRLFTAIVLKIIAAIKVMETVEDIKLMLNPLSISFISSAVTWDLKFKVSKLMTIDR